MSTIDNAVAERIAGNRPVIVLHDKKSRFWDSPVVFDSIEGAKREFLHTAHHSKDLKGRTPLFVDYPQDFELIHVGWWNACDGRLVVLDEADRSVFQVLDIFKGTDLEVTDKE